MYFNFSISAEAKVCPHLEKAALKVIFQDWNTAEVTEAAVQRGRKDADLYHIKERGSMKGATMQFRFCSKEDKFSERQQF